MNDYPIEVYADDGSIKETIRFSEDKENVRSSKYRIHKDDSISQIKTKILLLYPEVSYDELYVFAKVNKRINLFSLYQHVAKTSSKIGRKQKKTVDTAGFLDKKQFEQLLNNLGKNRGENKNKEYYDYMDLVKVCGAVEIDVPIGVGLGMHFSKYHNYMFSANPYKLIDGFTPNLLEDNSNTIYFLDNELLFNNGNVEDIGVAFAKDVFSFARQNGISEEYISKTYFPGLAVRGIFDRVQADKAQTDRAQTDKAQTDRAFEAIDQLYHLGQTSIHTIKFEQKGVRKYKFALKPEYDTIIPLDAIFKNIHANAATPLIKRNPGVRRENIYRIYSTEITQTGKKIPALPANKITHLANTIGKHKQISIYENELDIIIDIEENGVVYISGEFGKGISIEEMETILRPPVNAVLEKINGYLQNIGYSLPIIHSLRNDNVDFLTLDYVASIPMDDPHMKLRTKMGCLSSIFDVISDTVKTGAMMRFKRVENFQEMDAQSALITEVYKSAINEEDVITALVQNYNITVQEAALRIAQHLNNVKYIERKHGNKSIDIIENPGLPVELRYDSKNQKLIFRVEKLPHIEYIETLTIYLSGLVKLYTDEDNLSEKLKEICSRKMEKAAPMAKPTVVQHIDQKTKPKAFDINDFLQVEVPAAEDEKEDETVSPRASQTASPRASDFLMASPRASQRASPRASDFLSASVVKEPELELLKDDDDADLGSDEDFFGIDIDMEGGAKAKAKAKARSSSESDEGMHKSDIAQNTNYFLERLQEHDSVLFLKKRDKKFKVYSRTCPVMRQPVALSDNEKKRIDDADQKSKSRSYSKAIKYGSKADPNEKNWYICPRFWCYKTNTSMTKEQIDAGECGTDRSQIHEFVDTNYNRFDEPEQKFKTHFLKFTKDETQIATEKIHDLLSSLRIFRKTDEVKTKLDPNETGVISYNDLLDWFKKNSDGYIEFTPGFLDKAHPDFCVPCCFSKWDTELHKNRRKQCIRDKSHIIDRDIDSENQAPEDLKNPNVKARNRQPLNQGNKYKADYIEDPEKHPVNPNGWAQTQTAVQQFMQINYDSIFKIPEGQKIPTGYIEENKQTFLRHGMEPYEYKQIGEAKTSPIYKNSILGCLADVYAHEKKKDTVSIKEFVDILTTGAITIDDFVKYGNGTFQSIFIPKTKVGDKQKLVKKYADSELYKLYGKEKPSKRIHLDTFVKIIMAYENFIDFLKNPASEIDHTYIWDVVSTPNPNIFPEGLNLVIMEIANNDITNNIDVLCPTNAYSKNLFDEKKPTLFLTKNDDLFEPVYGYNYDGKTQPEITRTFTKAKSVTPNIKKVLDMLNNTVNNICKPHKSQPTKYLFENPVMSSYIEENLSNTKYTVRGQIMNYQGKIIALMVKKMGEPEEIYVPTHPSAPLPKHPIIFLDDFVPATYEKTRDLLKEMNRELAGMIPCLPRMKIIESGTIVGILTETNQFIQVKPIPKALMDADNLIPIEEKNYMLINDNEKDIQTSIEGDEKRIDFVKNISLENDFFSVFRTTLKSMIVSNTVFRNAVIKIIGERVKPYNERLRELIRLFKRITDKTVVFSDETDFHKDFAKTPYVCEDGKKNAVFKDNCVLTVADTNLVIENMLNSDHYYYRVADETLRYGKIQQFMISPKQFLNIANNDYTINKDEFIILEQFLLARDYFKNIEPYKLNQYVQNIPFGVAQPDPEISQKYSNSVSLEEQRAFGMSDNVSECKKELVAIGGERNNSNYWHNLVFKKSTKEIVFKATRECSFGILYYILQDFKPKRIFTEPEILKMVWEGYRELWNNEKYRKHVSYILKLQGKAQFADSWNRIMGLETTMPPDYFISALDIWVLAQYHKIPIVLFSSSTSIKQMGIPTMQSGTKLADPNPHRMNNSWIVLGKSDKGAADDKYYFVRSPTTKNTDSVIENSMIYGSFTIDDLGNKRENHFGVRLRDAINGGKDYGVRARKIEDFLADILIK